MLHYILSFFFNNHLFKFCLFPIQCLLKFIFLVSFLPLSLTLVLLPLWLGLTTMVLPVSLMILPPMLDKSNVLYSNSLAFNNNIVTDVIYVNLR